jgi:hypothetical protein
MAVVMSILALEGTRKRVKQLLCAVFQVFVVAGGAKNGGYLLQQQL